MRRLNLVGVETTKDVEEGQLVLYDKNENFEDDKLSSTAGGKIDKAKEKRKNSSSSNRSEFSFMDLFQRFNDEDLTNFSLNDHQWTLQRKKIGLEGRSSASKERKNWNKLAKATSLNFIKTKFSRKDCVRYEEDSKVSKRFGEDVCRCRNPISKHDSNQVQPFFVRPESKNESVDNGLTNGSMNPLQPPATVAPPPRPRTSSPWTPESALKKSTTNAYGMIEFTNENTGSTKPAKYVRLADTSNMEDVITLLIDHWHLFEPSKPNLIISVIGGAMNFSLDGKKKKTFNDGLIQAVKATGAWIITDGKHLGVPKCVGEAVNEGQYTVKVKRKTLFNEEQEHLVGGVTCIGIAPWGYIKDNHLLINNDLNDFHTVRYKVEDTDNSQYVSLNGDHTHFLLVDDGFNRKPCGANKFRAEFQKAIQKPVEGGRPGIQVVTLLLEGGLDSLFKCSLALKSNVPVVAVANTGRAADLLALGVSMLMQIPDENKVLTEDQLTQLESRVNQTMTEYEPNQCKKVTSVIVECCKRAHLITIFDINSGEGMDRSILHALLKDELQDNEEGKIEQLKLALLWNRPDIAESHILTFYDAWPTYLLADLMTKALIQEKVEFVKLFLLNGLVMNEYLNVWRLRILYQLTHLSDTHFGRITALHAKGKEIYLVHLHFILEALVKKHYDPVYTDDNPNEFSLINDGRTFDDPYLELMLWAILNKRPNLARYLWERCNSPLVAAIVATCIYKSLSKFLGAKNTEKLQEYTENKNMFEKLAIDYLSECFKHDSNNAIAIVERRNPKWGGLDCLQLAAAAEDLLFISSPCCQASVDISWMRGMTRAPRFGILLLAYVFPPAIFTRLFRFQKLGDEGGDLTAVQKIIVFYKSPISKFYSHSFVYVCFLLLYTYVVLFDFKPEMSIPEMVAIGLISTTFLEEIHQIFKEDSTRLSAKFVAWWGNVWNRFDVISFVLSSIAFILRLNPKTFSSGRVLYAVNTNFFYMRLFRTYHASYELGPKLVIFYRMIPEVVVFLSILLIVILGYGVASQALLHPVRTYGDSNITTILGQVILMPYWQMYGELLLEEMKGDDNKQCHVDWGGEEICENPLDYTWVVNTMLVFYLIFGNIMLLNLLIAIFSYVFNEVHENSMVIGKYEMYKLIKEFDSKPCLVPPLVIFEHLYRICRCAWRTCCVKTDENIDEHLNQTLKSLSIFEKEELLSFLSMMRDKDSHTLESIAFTTAEKVDRITKYIDQEEERKRIEKDLEMTFTKEENEEAEEEKEAMDQSVVKPITRKSTKAKREKEAEVKFELEGTDEEEMLQLDDEENSKLRHPISQALNKVYLEGFDSLPFNMGSQPSSRPSSTKYSRPVTGGTLQLALSQTRRLTLQDQISTLISRMDDLQSKVEDTHDFVQKSMKTICNKLAKQETRERTEKQESKENWKPESIQEPIQESILEQEPKQESNQGKSRNQNKLLKLQKNETVAKK